MMKLDDVCEVPDVIIIQILNGIIIIHTLEFHVSLYIGFVIICNYLLNMNSKGKVVPS